MHRCGPALIAPGRSKQLAAGVSADGRLRRQRKNPVGAKQRPAAPATRRRRLPDAALDADAARRAAAASRNCASNQADGRRGPQGRRHVAG